MWPRTQSFEGAFGVEVLGFEGLGFRVQGLGFEGPWLILCPGTKPGHRLPGLPLCKGCARELTRSHCFVLVSHACLETHSSPHGNSAAKLLKKGPLLDYVWVARKIRVPFGVRFIRVAYYIGDP